MNPAEVEFNGSSQVCVRLGSRLIQSFCSNPLISSQESPEYISGVSQLGCLSYILLLNPVWMTHRWLWMD